MVYAEAAAICGFPMSRRALKKGGIDTPGFWEHPPPWAGPPELNSNLIGGDDPPPAPAPAPAGIPRQAITRRIRV
ncbi:MAG: hypothetical protein IPK48_07725 [Gammaproteobacteria bacterium]|nr:hypothetical protein [Gammaproteobacteria bacterium]